MKKRIVSVMFCAVLAFGLIACNKNNDHEDLAESETTSESTTESSDEEQLDINEDELNSDVDNVTETDDSEEESSNEDTEENEDPNIDDEGNEDIEEDDAEEEEQFWANINKIAKDAKEFVIDDEDRTDVLGQQIRLEEISDNVLGFEEEISTSATSDVLDSWEECKVSFNYGDKEYYVNVNSEKVLDTNMTEDKNKSEEVSTEDYTVTVYRVEDSKVMVQFIKNTEGSTIIAFNGVDSDKVSNIKFNDVDFDKEDSFVGAYKKLGKIRTMYGYLLAVDGKYNLSQTYRIIKGSDYRFLSSMMYVDGDDKLVDASDNTDDMTADIWYSFNYEDDEESYDEDEYEEVETEATEEVKDSAE